MLVLVSYPEWGGWTNPILSSWVPTFTKVALWISVILTGTSGILYLWRNRTLYLEDK